MQNTKWILFDFGGCLDSDGLHSRTLYMNQFYQNNLIKPEIEYDTFNNAYTWSDEILIKNSLAINSNLYEMNECMCVNIANFLAINDLVAIKKVASSITKFQETHLKRNQKTIKELSTKFKLGIVSNFCGNLLQILHEYSLDSYFTFILDSYHVGANKPDPKIFQLAIQLCQVTPEEIYFVGDNPVRDIAPARALGMKTILISPFTRPTDSNYVLSSVAEILELSHNI